MIFINIIFITVSLIIAITLWGLWWWFLILRPVSQALNLDKPPHIFPLLVFVASFSLIVFALLIGNIGYVVIAVLFSPLALIGLLLTITTLKLYGALLSLILLTVIVILLLHKSSAHNRIWASIFASVIFASTPLAVQNYVSNQKS